MSTAVYFMLAFSLATVYRLNRIFINEKLDTVVITNGDLVKYTITGMVFNIHFIQPNNIMLGSLDWVCILFL